MPIGPFVAALRAPVVEMMRDAAVPEHFGEAVGRARHFPRAAAGREVDVAGAVLVEKPGVVQVCDVVDRVIEIKIVVVHAVHGIAHGASRSTSWGKF